MPNNEVKHWGIEFNLNINPIRSSDIVKNLVSHSIKENNLSDQIIDINSFGQGLQRHLIYTLLKLSAKYTQVKKPIKKEFFPDFTLILFEEPEAFLHPSQQEKMNINLKNLANNTQQIIITTHSPIFSSKNIKFLTSIVKIKKRKKTRFFQLSDDDMSTLLDKNTSMFTYFHEIFNNEKTDESLKKSISNNGLYQKHDDNDVKLKQEQFKYSLWLDSERTSLLFSRHVIICEGATEKVFLDYLISNDWSDFKDENLYILDSLGKFNIHRFMNLFGYLGIDHSVLMDSDNNKIQSLINKFIKNNENKFTKKIHLFEKDFESFLNITSPTRRDLKPLNIMYKYSENKISAEKLAELRKLIEKLAGIETKTKKMLLEEG